MDTGRYVDTPLLKSVARLLRERGDLAAFERLEFLLAETVKISRETHGDKHKDTLVTINNLASMLDTRGDLAAAEPLYREALQARRETLGDRHKDTLVAIQ